MTDPRELPEALQPDEDIRPSFRMWAVIISTGLAVTIVGVCAVWNAI